VGSLVDTGCLKRVEDACYCGFSGYVYVAARPVSSQALATSCWISPLPGQHRWSISKIEDSQMRIAYALLTAGLAGIACSETSTPTAPTLPAPNVAQDRSTGDTPNYNLEVLLNGEGFGHVKFRQAGNDDLQRVDLTVWVRGLAPNTSYLLQRAVDTNLDGDCTSSSWLTLGDGTAPHAITTDDRGVGTADLFRNLPPAGGTFDIHFRVITVAAGAVVLTSDCYQYTVKLVTG
jgi:hypothetical protein